MAISPDIKASRKQQDIIANLREKDMEDRLRKRAALRKWGIEYIRTGEDAEIEKAQLAQAEKEKTTATGPNPLSSMQSSPVDAGKVGSHSAKLLNAFNAPEVETGSTVTETPGPASGGGLPPKELIHETVNKFEQPLGGKIGQVLQMFGSDFGTRERTSTSTRKSVNPAYAREVEERSVFVANAAHAQSRGILSGQELVKTMEQQLGPLDPEARAQSRAIIQRTMGELKIQQGETDIAQAITLAGQFAKDGIHSPGLVLQGARAETPEQIEAYGLAVQKAYQNSPKEVRARRIQELELESAELTAKINQNKYDDDNAARAANEINDEKLGVFYTNGAHTTLTEKQIADGQDESWYQKSDGDKVLNIKEDKIPTYSKWIEGELALWKTMNMPLPEKGFFGSDTLDTGNEDNEKHWKKSRDKVFQLDPDEVYTHVLTVNRLSFTKDGKVAENDNEIDVETTESIRQSSYDWLNLNGFDAEPDESGQALIAPHPDFPYPKQLTKLLNITRSTINAGDRRGVLILSPNNFRGTDVEAARIPPVQTTSMTPEFAAGIVRAEKEEFQRKKMESRGRQLEELGKRFPGQF